MVHVPFAFMFLSAALDVLYYASITPATSSTVLSALKAVEFQLDPAALPVLSHYITILTLAFSVPAIVTGAMELAPVIKRDGFSSKKAQIGVVHALVNEVTVFGTAYNYWTRRSNIGFAPSPTNVLVSAVAHPASVFAAYLGAKLVYQYGMGVGRGSSRAKKSQ
ncbi:hypothetical protein BS50DRAFT_568992 [Corynespora cassiicola Philippines]|uniref:DUF2231 domain-containing protein n=1 Tax=Corynespora cassiicola Philippines TaxID=1448308 RepID=A0A2T2P6Z7_CORCC|nr:hypothetical protein BS50DRAFT_568992 [Corynespora cassiicola Philippines]